MRKFYLLGRHQGREKSRAERYKDLRALYQPKLSESPSESRNLIVIAKMLRELIIIGKTHLSSVLGHAQVLLGWPGSKERKNVAQEGYKDLEYFFFDQPKLSESFPGLS